MGKYEEIFGSIEECATSLTAEEALIGIVTIAVFADGQPVDEENIAVSEIVNNLDVFEDCDRDDIQAMFDKTTAIVHQDSLGALFNASVEALPEDWVETAFAAAAEVVLADNTIHEAEDSFLSDLADALELSHQAAQEIIDEILEAV